MKIQIEFINKDNADKYKQEVLSWLKLDFEARGKPKRGTFWLNRDVIKEAFNEFRAIVAINSDEVVGFMIWNMINNGSVAKIVIVEVKKPYRRQGIFTKFISELENTSSKVCLLTAYVLEESRAIFRKAANWQELVGQQSVGRFCKVVNPVLPELSELPEGYAIAVCSQADIEYEEWLDAYTIIKNPNKYSKKYFQIDLGENRKLKVPIATPFHHEGYVGVYHNKKLITEGKVKHIFEDTHCEGFLVLNQLRLIEAQLLSTQGFLAQGKRKKLLPEIANKDDQASTKKARFR